MSSFKNLQVNSAFPKEELYGLVSQIRRAGVSIPEYCRRIPAAFQKTGQAIFSISLRISSARYYLFISKEFSITNGPNCLV